MCPYYKNKEVFDSFNEMVEAFGGKPLTEEEFRSSELRKLRTGQNLLAMEAAYRCYHLNNGNFLDKAPNGKDSMLFKSLLDLLGGDRKKAILEKGKVFSDNFFNWFGDWTVAESEDIPYQLISHLRRSNINVHGKYRMQLYLRKYSDKLVLLFIGKKKRELFKKQLIKARPDLDPNKEIDSILDFLHSLEDDKENSVYISTAIRWIVNRSITLPEDHEKAYQAFKLARKKHLDLLKYNTLGELIAAPEMQPKDKKKKPFDPDEAKTFSNKRTVTTTGGRVFTVYDVENTEEGQREVCKALAAHYEMSPWCLSTFTSTGEPTESAKRYWETYSALPRKIAYENGKPVAFNSSNRRSDESTGWVLEGIEVHPEDWEVKPSILYRDVRNQDTVKNLENQGLIVQIGADKYKLTEEGKKHLSQKDDKEAWWDMEDRYPKDTLSDSIVSEQKSMLREDMDLFDDDPELVEPDPRNLLYMDVRNAIRDIVNEYILNFLQDLHLVPDGLNELWVRNILADRCILMYDEDIDDAYRTIYNAVNNIHNNTANEIALRILEQLNIFDYIRNNIHDEVQDLQEPVPVAPLYNEPRPGDDDYLLPFFMTPNGEVYGFVTPNNDIYLDEEIISPQHPIHEYTHIWDRIVAKKNPELWKRGVELMKQTSEWDEILNDDNYGKKWSTDESISKSQLEFLVASEVHSRLVGENGESIINDIAKEKGSKDIVNKLRQWLLDFWKSLKSTFSNFSDEELQKLTLEEFNTMTVRDFVELNDENNVSKAVDENGEPLVLWHGTENIFDVFEVDETGKRGAHKVHDRHSFFFTDTKEKAFKYRRAITMPVYLKMDNPGESSVYDGKFNTLNEYTERENEIIRDPQYDSAIFVRYDKEGDRRGMVPTKQWVVKDPNLIKSIYNFGTFSKNSDNIYHNRTILSMRDYLNDLLKHPKYRWKVKDLIARANRFYGRLMFHLYRDSDTHEFKVAIDQHIDGLLLDEIQRTYSRNENAIKEICEFLKSKFPDSKLTYDFYDEKLWHDFGFPLASNSFIRGNRVYLRKGRVTTEIAAEEFLHTLVYNLKYDNPTLYNNLLRYARKNFEKLNEEINLAYAEHQNRDEELVTLVLARYFNNKFDQSINVEKSKRNTLDSLLNRFKNWLIKLFKTAPVFSQYLQKYEITADNINPLVGFDDIADLLLTEDTAFVVNPISSQQTRFSVSAQDRLDAANKSVIEQYKLLYKHFDSVAKLSNKPEDSIRHENLFRTISELRQRASDEALLYFVKQALDDIGEVGTTNPKTILYKLEKSYKLPDPFSDMTPQDIMNLKRYVIGFYQNVLKQIPRYDSDIFKNNPIFNTFVDDLKRLTESVDRAYYLWTLAVRISGDRIIDKIVDEDVTMADEQKENMKVVAKDWLHRNLFYGDISERLSQLVLSSGNNNLVVRMAMNLIGYAELRRAEDSQHANNLLDRQRRRCLKNIKRAATPGNWETMFMEVDDDGVPTGNFSRPANYGLYEKDKNQFLKDLCERWERDYGFYYTEIDGDYVNSATGDRGVDENWIKDPATGKWIEPMYVKWLREIEMFDGDRIHRRYTHEYYMELLTRPFTGSIEDLNNIAAPAAHGLSPKTRHKYNYYIENINYYLLKCIDRSTGIPHPERLSATDRVKLKMWLDAKKDLENPYTASGAPKVDEEFTMALEIAAWNKWVASKTNSSLDYDLYEKELLSVQNEANRTGNLQIVSDFINFNTELKIHPDYLPKFFKRWGNSNWMKYTAVLDQISRLIKIPNYPWSVDLSIVKNNIFFLIDAKNADAALNANINKPDYVDGKPDKGTLKALAEEYEDKISEHLAPYIDPSGRMWTKSGQPYNPSIHNQNDLLTWFDYLLEHFTNVAINSGTIPGIVDRLGNPVPCRSMTKLQIRDILEFLIFRVNKTFWLNGARVIRQVPLSIFNVKLPRYSDFIAGDGKRHKTIELVPNSSYFAKGGSIIDSEYNPFDQESFVPDMNFGSGRYDNRKNFNKIKSDPELNRMYNMMIASMKHSWELIGFQRGRFNYKLPLIEASYDSILSRIGKYGVSKTVDMAWRKLSNVQQRDENMRTNEQLIKMPDGTEAEDVPKRYIDPLDDPALITSNVIGSVALFRDAAYNYAYKQGVQSAIEILAQNMNTQFRQESTPENPEYVNSKGAELFSTAENSEAAMKYILETQVYGNKTEAGFGEHRDNKLYTAAMHVIGWSLRMEMVVMLGLNLISIGVGLGSSTIRLIKEAFMGRYLTPWDFGRGLAKTLYDLPMIVGNFGNTLTNNKTGALMLIFGVSKNQYATYINMANGRISKFLGNILMGGYSMLDWWANAVVLSSYMHNVRFYDGDEIPKGFYSGYQMKAAFKSAGYSKAHANREYMKCTTTLYGVYKYKDGTCIIDPRYKEYVTPKIKKEIYTKTHKRIALYNGVTPDNDEIRVKKSILGRFIFALRGFLLTQAHHLGGGLTANGYDDTTVYDVGIKNDRTILGGKVKSKQVLYKSKRTAADNEHRMGWDFETGTPLDDIYHNLIRATVTSFRKIAHAASAGKVESRKFSLAERYAAIDALIYLLIMIAMMIAWPTIHDWAQDLVKYPTGPETAGLEESFGNYGLNYIDNGIYAAQVDAIMMRLNVELLTNIDITTVGELITAVTSLLSGYKDTFGGPLTLTSDALGLSGHNPTEMCRKGTAYTYETRLTRGLYKTFGAPDNLHASFTSRHLAANQKWYFNQYGKLYEWFGYKPEWKWSTLSGNGNSGGKGKSSKKKSKSSKSRKKRQSSRDGGGYARG